MYRYRLKCNILWYETAKQSGGVQQIQDVTGNAQLDLADVPHLQNFQERATAAVRNAGNEKILFDSAPDCMSSNQEKISERFYPSPLEENITKTTLEYDDWLTNHKFLF